jgi:hypothetical protein
VSELEDTVNPSRFWPAVGLSLTLHVAIAGAVVGVGFARARALSSSTLAEAYAGGDVAPSVATAAATLPVEVESPAMSSPQVDHALGVVVSASNEPELGAIKEQAPRDRRQKKPIEVRSRAPMVAPKKPEARSAVARLDDADQRDETAAATSSGASLETLPPTGTVVGDGVTAAAASAIDRNALHQAMQSAASDPNRGLSAWIQPSIRVDPREKNLDRAFARAFAPAFSADPGLFVSPPIGTARFVVRLADGGRIGDVVWIGTRTPPRLKALVAQMVKLLSLNRFRAPRTDESRSTERAFEMRIAESRVTVPDGIANAAPEVGAIWMLGAGETPTIGHASHPTVADATGHLVSCELRIVEPLPEIE